MLTQKLRILEWQNLVGDVQSLVAQLQDSDPLLGFVRRVGGVVSNEESEGVGGWSCHVQDCEDEDEGKMVRLRE
ncbi:MAG: hypothetical protein WEB60_01395 [Terrimicrobiaceae bacterium]